MLDVHILVKQWYICAYCQICYHELHNSIQVPTLYKIISWFEFKWKLKSVKLIFKLFILLFETAKKGSSKFQKIKEVKMSTKFLIF